MGKNKPKKHKSRRNSQFGDKAVQRHDKVNQSYLDGLKGMEIIYNNLEYMNPKKTYVVGELDGFCYRRTPQGNFAYIIETKGTMNPSLKNKAKSQLERAVKKFIPLFEERNDIKFDKVFTYYANPKEIKLQKMYKESNLETKIKDERLEFKQETEDVMKYVLGKIKQNPSNTRYLDAMYEAHASNTKAIKDYYQNNRPTRRW